jgi:hypothetical protein
MTPTSLVERAHRFGRHASLIGIVTSDAAAPARIPVVILGAGIIHKVGPSRVSVELARALARQGHPTLRFDLSGIGDSGRAREASLEAAVVADIRDAIDLIVDQVEGGHPDGVCLVGFCSGADNAFYLSDEDSRVRGAAMFDPTVHPTPGFTRRRLLDRATSARSWLNLVSGRSIMLRLRPTDSARPPGYYGLLSTGPEETDRRAARAVARGVHFLYCISGAAQRYCNAPEQIEEALPTGYSADHIEVAWRPEMDHILSDPSQREDFIGTVGAWLDDRFPAAG